MHMNLFMLLRNIYLEIIRYGSLLLAGCSDNAAWNWLSLALIPIVKWKANLVQLLFPEWNHLSIAFCCLLVPHPPYQVPQHCFAVGQHRLSLVLCLITSRPPPLLVFEPFHSAEHGIPLEFM